MITSFEKFFESLLEAKTWDKFKNLKAFSGVTSLDGVVIDDASGNVIMDMDPTDTKDYRNWLIKMYKQMNFDEFLQNAEKMNQLLTIYDSGKGRLPEPQDGNAKQDKRNISNIKSIDELNAIVNYILENQLHLNKKKKMAVSYSDRVELYEDEDWMIVIPLTHEQSKFWAKGARWCTARAQESSYFRDYSKTSPLYIFHNKNNHIGSYQLWLAGTSGGNYCVQFKNYDNEEVRADNFLKANTKLIEPLLSFWESNNPVLKDSLGVFVDGYIRKKITDNRDSWGYIFGLIMETGFINSLANKDIEVIIESALESNSMKLIKQYFEKNPEKVLSKFSKGKTPISLLTSSGDSQVDAKTDLNTLKTCKYLVSIAENMGKPIMTDSELSESISSCLQTGKYKTALFLSEIPGVDLSGIYGSNTTPASGNNLPLLLCAKVTLSEDGHNGLSYDEFSKLLSNLKDKGVNFNQKVGNSTAIALLIKRLAKPVYAGTPEQLKLIELLILNTIDVCDTINQIYELEPNVSQSPEISNVLNSVSSKAGC